MLKIKKTLGVVLVLMLCFGTLFVPVFAEDLSVSLKFVCEGTPVKGNEFRLYKVADTDCTPTEDFSAYPVDFSFNDAETMSAAAETLTYYIGRDGITPDKKAVTNEDGYVFFNVAQEGVYLLVGDKAKVGDTVYTPESILFFLPSKGTVGEEVCSLELSPKFDKETESEAVDRKVLKTWKNDSNLARPDSVVVELLRDGEVYDTVILSDANSWRHEWKDLDGSKSWTLTEKAVPEGYTVSVSQEGITFHVVNKGPTPPPDEPDDEDKDDEDIIPETGVLWWPVPYIACLGLLLIIIGYVKKQNETE